MKNFYELASLYLKLVDMEVGRLIQVNFKNKAKSWGQLESMS